MIKAYAKGLHDRHRYCFEAGYPFMEGQEVSAYRRSWYSDPAFKHPKYVKILDGVTLTMLFRVEYETSKNMMLAMSPTQSPLRI